MQLFWSLFDTGRDVWTSAMFDLGVLTSNELFQQVKGNEESNFQTWNYLNDQGHTLYKWGGMVNISNRNYM